MKYTLEALISIDWRQFCALRVAGVWMKIGIDVYSALMVGIDTSAVITHVVGDGE